MRMITVQFNFLMKRVYKHVAMRFISGHNFQSYLVFIRHSAIVPVVRATVHSSFLPPSFSHLSPPPILATRARCLQMHGHFRRRSVVFCFSFFCSSGVCPSVRVQRCMCVALANILALIWKSGPSCVHVGAVIAPFAYAFISALFLTVRAQFGPVRLGPLACQIRVLISRNCRGLTGTTNEARDCGRNDLRNPIINAT